jgi:hypothetical protein
VSLCGCAPLQVKNYRSEEDHQLRTVAYHPSCIEELPLILTTLRHQAPQTTEQPKHLLLDPVAFAVEKETVSFPSLLLITFRLNNSIFLYRPTTTTSQDFEMPILIS